MRPVNKWTPGEVTLPDGSKLTVNASYNNYRMAKGPLVMNLGHVCSYCEKAYEEERDLQVEHIQPKGYKDAAGNLIYEHLKTEWSNFLLSCGTCNGKDNKDTKNVVYGECHLPHLNNTFLSVIYRTGGVVMVNPGLTGKSRDNAENLLKLVGLDKGPANSGKGDKRWECRLEKWNVAERYRNDYVNGKKDLETIIDYVKATGHWSIWFTVFKGCDEVRRALTDAFSGNGSTVF